MKNKQVLGRGLGALIMPDFDPDISNETFKSISERELRPDDGNLIDVIAKISVADIVENPFQPRTEFKPEALDELKKSILANGLIQPITVRRHPAGGYELISGERRLRCFRDIGYKDIPAYIIEVDSNETMLALALIENIQREKLNAIEVAKAYKRLLDECNLSQEEIAESVGKERSTITNSIRLLKLPSEIQDNIINEKLSAGHARALINVPDEATQIELMRKVISENLSVRKIENLVKSIIEGPSEKKTNKKIPEISRQQMLSQRDVEEKLRRVFGTKVLCKQKQDGTGEIVIEFYSNDELERLFEMFEIIGKEYN